jgi:two-component system alkaline phosphatase synthesis response regulator PhoP
MAYKILVIEDEPSLNRILRFDLESAGYLVTTALDGETGWHLAKQERFDCLIVDWMVPKLSGPELIKRLRDDKHEEIIIMLTAKTTELDVIEGLSAGADFYLKKPFSSRELLAQLKSLFHRFTSQGGDIFHYNDVTIDTQAHQFLIEGYEIKVTKREFELLTLMFQNEGKLLTRDFLLNTIWGFDYDGTTRIVDVHISRLRAILEASSFEINAIHGSGYTLAAKKK